MLTELIEQANTIESQTEGLIREELKKVFGKHIEEIVTEILNENMENVKKALDMNEENSAEGNEKIEEIFSAIRAHKKNKKSEKNTEEIETIAGSILKVML